MKLFVESIWFLHQFVQFNFCHTMLVISYPDADHAAFAWNEAEFAIITDVGGISHKYVLGGSWAFLKVVSLLRSKWPFAGRWLCQKAFGALAKFKMDLGGWVVFLGGVFQHVLFSPLPGEGIQFDEHIFQLGWNHQLVFNLKKSGTIISDARSMHGLSSFIRWDMATFFVTIVSQMLHVWYVYLHFSLFMWPFFTSCTYIIPTFRAFGF